MEDYRKKFMVRPGEKLRLKRIDPGYRGHHESSETAAHELARQCARLTKLQTLLYAEKKHSTVIIRGLRAISDFEYEFQMAMMNHRLKPQLETLFMMTGESEFYISSRLVKEVVSLGGDVSGLVPDNVLRKLNQKFKR